MQSDPVTEALRAAAAAACSTAFGPCTCEKPEDCVETGAWKKAWPPIAAAAIAAFLRAYACAYAVANPKDARADFARYLVRAVERAARERG